MIRETTTINGTAVRLRHFGCEIERTILVDSYPEEINGKFYHIIDHKKIPAHEYDIKTIRWEQVVR